MTLTLVIIFDDIINPLTPNDRYRGHTALLTSKRCILYIYSTNIDTEYFKHGIYSLSFSLQNAVCFIILTYLVPVLFTFYIQCGHVTPLYPQKLALTSPTGGGSSVGMVRSRTKATEFSFSG